MTYRSEITQEQWANFIDIRTERFFLQTFLRFNIVNISYYKQVCMYYDNNAVRFSIDRL